MSVKPLPDASAFGRVAVLMGGAAAEREVSLRSGRAVLQALRNRGIDAEGFDVDQRLIRPLIEDPRGFDRVFNILHGRGGEDGVLQGALEVLGIPYTGSGVLASALSMDKRRAKLCWMGANLPTPPWLLLDGEAAVEELEQRLGYPVIIKPAEEGSSIGMSRAEDRAGLMAAWEAAAVYNCDVFAEKWIVGREYTAAVLQGEPLPLIRLETPHVFYDFDAKYRAETTRYHCPCGLSADAEARLQRLALAACEVLGVAGWARVDLMVDEQDQPWLIEVNTVPGMTDHSLVPMAARQAGMDFDELVCRVLATSLRPD